MATGLTMQQNSAGRWQHADGILSSETFIRAKELSCILMFPQHYNLMSQWISQPLTKIRIPTVNHAHTTEINFHICKTLQNDLEQATSRVDEEKGKAVVIQVMMHTRREWGKYHAYVWPCSAKQQWIPMTPPLESGSAWTCARGNCSKAATIPPSRPGTSLPTEFQ